MHDGMPCDPIQGQGQGHGASEVPKIALFSLSPPPLTEGAGKLPLILKLQHNIYIGRARFLKFVLVFMSHDLELGRGPCG